MPFDFLGALSVVYKLVWQTDTDWTKGTLSSTTEISGTGDSGLIQLKERDERQKFKEGYIRALLQGIEEEQRPKPLPLAPINNQQL